MSGSGRGVAGDGLGTTWPMRLEICLRGRMGGMGSQRGPLPPPGVSNSSFSSLYLQRFRSQSEAMKAAYQQNPGAEGRSVAQCNPQSAGGGTSHTVLHVCTRPSPLCMCVERGAVETQEEVSEQMNCSRNRMKQGLRGPKTTHFTACLHSRFVLLWRRERLSKGWDRGEGNLWAGPGRKGLQVRGQLARKQKRAR